MSLSISSNEKHCEHYYDQFPVMALIFAQTVFESRDWIFRFQANFQVEKEIVNNYPYLFQYAILQIGTYRPTDTKLIMYTPHYS